MHENKGAGFRNRALNPRALTGSDSCAAKKLLEHDVLTVESVEDVLKSDIRPPPPMR